MVAGAYPARRHRARMGRRAEHCRRASPGSRRIRAMSFLRGNRRMGGGPRHRRMATRPARVDRKLSLPALQHSGGSGAPNATGGTSGRNSAASSRSAILQSALESRLRANLDVDGSPEYVLTWKRWPMRSGAPICALRARGRRTSDRAFGGWASPTHTDGRRGSLPPRPQDTGVPLDQMVQLVGSATPTSSERSGQGERNVSLMQQVKLAGYPTPNAMPENRGWLQSNPEKALERRSQGHMLNLDDVAALAGWGTPRVTTNGGHPSPESTGKGSRLEDQAGLSLAGWPSTSLSDAKGGPTGDRIVRKSGSTQSRASGGTLAYVAEQLVGWHTPHCPRENDSDHSASTYLDRQLSGAISTSCPSATEKRGALRPGHSRWLMGYRAAWDSCGATAMQSCRKSRRSSSRRSSRSKGACKK